VKKVKNEFHDGIEVLKDVWFMFDGIHWSQDGSTGEYEPGGSYALNLPNIMKRAEEQGIGFTEKFTNVITHETLHKIIHELTGDLLISKKLDFVNAFVVEGEISQSFTEYNSVCNILQRSREGG